MIGQQVVLLLFSPMIYCRIPSIGISRKEVVLGNACGPGVVRKELISRTGDITVQAADFSEAMLNHMKSPVSNEEGAKITIQVMNAQVYHSECVVLIARTYVS